MIHAVITYIDSDLPVDEFDLITYVRGEGYWQLLCMDGRTVLLPDSSILNMVLSGARTEEEADA